MLITQLNYSKITQYICSMTTRDDVLMALPAMRALPNDRWRAFVLAWVRSGRSNAGRVYSLVFRNPNLPSCRVAACRRLADGRVERAVKEVVATLLRPIEPPPAPEKDDPEQPK